MEKNTCIISHLVGDTQPCFGMPVTSPTHLGEDSALDFVQVAETCSEDSQRDPCLWWLGSPIWSQGTQKKPQISYWSVLIFQENRLLVLCCLHGNRQFLQSLWPSLLSSLLLTATTWRWEAKRKYLKITSWAVSFLNARTMPALLLKVRRLEWSGWVIVQCFSAFFSQTRKIMFRSTWAK